MSFVVSFFLKSSGFGECREYRGPKIPILLFRAESNQNLKGTAVVVVVVASFLEFIITRKERNGGNSENSFFAMLGVFPLHH